MKKTIKHFTLIILMLTYNLVLGKNENKSKGEQKEKSKRSNFNDITLDNFNFVKNSKPVDKVQPFFWTIKEKLTRNAEGNIQDLGRISDFTNCKTYTSSNQKYGWDNEPLPGRWNRGLRYSDNFNDKFTAPFWGNRGRRQEDEQFWGNRGRRQDDGDEDFWANRGRSLNDPFLSNHGREEDPFWGNRGRSLNDVYYDWKSNVRRQEQGEFWRNQGHGEGKKIFVGRRSRRKEDLREEILDAIDNVQRNIYNLSKKKKSENPYVSNSETDSKTNYLVNGRALSYFSGFAKSNFPTNDEPNMLNVDNPELKTVLDDRIYAEQPHYILVERSSRSSAEEDPYYITRGKKRNLDLSSIDRDRRGALEEIVKSVRSDPYYIARGKKDDLNSIIMAKVNKFLKSEDISSVKPKIEKRDVESSENERDRRTILRKLAEKLQLDPYFVSRGKKSFEFIVSKDSLHEFLNEIANDFH